MAIGGALKAAGKLAASAGLEHPIAAGLGAAVGLPILGGAAKGIYRGISGEASMDRKAALRLAVEQERVRHKQELLVRARSQRLERDMAANIARLAAVNPQMYNEIISGRRLPQGAVILGGRPRVDLLQELAYNMATGSYHVEDPQNELAQLLGGM